MLYDTYTRVGVTHGLHLVISTTRWCNSRITIVISTTQLHCICLYACLFLGATKSLMYFDGCATNLGCTVTLRGGPQAELKAVCTLDLFTILLIVNEYSISHVVAKTNSGMSSDSMMSNYAELF